MKLVVTGHTILKPNAYRVKLVGVQTTPGTYGEQLRFRLQVTEGEHAGTQVTAWANASTSLHSKAVRWASAFNPSPFGQGDLIDFDALIGKSAIAVVEIQQTEDGREFNRVTDILPLRPVAGRQQNGVGGTPPPAPKPTHDEERSFLP